jgi:hypothetical protein
MIVLFNSFHSKLHTVVNCAGFFANKRLFTINEVSDKISSLGELAEDIESSLLPLDAVEVEPCAFKPIALLIFLFFI